MSQATMQVDPIALAPGEGDALWFLGCLVTVKAPAETTGGRVAVLEHVSPRGAGSPMRDAGKYVTTYRRDADGSWLMVNDIWNSDGR